MTQSAADILLLNGPNLNRLGKREPDIYGDQTLADIERALQEEASRRSLTLAAFQSNAEHALIERIHAAGDEGTAFILINPGAFTHTSIALRDALLSVEIPFIEIHLSNVAAREPFRHTNYFHDIAVGSITGMGASGYVMALHGACQFLQQLES
ncbi:MAG: type II 3-dehydroquinate dehydratase [Pseudomonadota bacterium]